MTRDQHLKTLEEVRHRSTEALDELTDSLIREAVPTPEKRNEWREEFRKLREPRDRAEEIQNKLVKDIIGELDHRINFFELCFMYLINPKLRRREGRARDEFHTNWTQLLTPAEMETLDRYLLLLGDKFADIAVDVYRRKQQQIASVSKPSRRNPTNEKIVRELCEKYPGQSSKFLYLKQPAQKMTEEEREKTNTPLLADRTIRDIKVELNLP